MPCDSKAPAPLLFAEGIHTHANMSTAGATDAGDVALPPPHGVECATERRIASVFRAHDADGNGSLDVAELQPALSCLGVFVDKVRVLLMIAPSMIGVLLSRHRGACPCSLGRWTFDLRLRE